MSGGGGGGVDITRGVEAKEGRMSIDHHPVQVPNASLALEEEQDNGQSRHSSVFFSLEAWSNIKSVSGGGGGRVGITCGS